MNLPLSPCGRAVELLRSCYTADMQFFHDSSATLPVVWYFVPDDRETLPFKTVFCSRLYERKEDAQLPIGEKYSPVPWRGGQVPGPVAECGNCGNKDAWLKGVSIEEPLPAVYPGTNVPVCCSKPPPLPIGGTAVGGKFVGPSPPRRPGGLAVGGKFKHLVLWPPHGGTAVGGRFAPIITVAKAGGLALGGTPTSVIHWALKGGEGLGGVFTNTTPAAITGGHGGGGSGSNSPPGLSSACCASVMPTTGTAVFSGGTGTAVAMNGIHVAMTGQSFSGITQYFGTWTTGAGTQTLNIQCLTFPSAHWACSNSPISFFGTLTGTCGIGSTNLSGTFTVSGSLSGTITVTFTG